MDSPDDIFSERKVFSYLKPYQIMSIKSYYRQPTYCDFDLRINLIQNSLSLAEKNINQDIFKVIETYFKYEIEDFNVIFLLSTLVTKINEYISDINGVNVDFTTKLNLHKTMYDQEAAQYQNNKTIFISLAFPFERIYDYSGLRLLETTYLPQISSLMPGVDLFVNFDDFWAGVIPPDDPTYDPNVVNSSAKVIACPIHIGTDNTGPITGYYFIRNDYQLNIELQLYFSDDGTAKTGPVGDWIDVITFVGREVTANINENLFFTDMDYGYLDLVYPGLDSTSWQNITRGVNIPFDGYTMPRLRSVKFI
jgi:hypothetical protein